MGYYLRYISTDKRVLDLQEIIIGLKKFDPKFSIEIDNSIGGRVTSGILLCENNKCADLEINSAGDGLFEDEIEELAESASEMRGTKKHIVTQALKNANATLAAQVLFQNRKTDVVLEIINPLWKFLYIYRTGILQVDCEGYFDATGQLLIEE